MFLSPCYSAPPTCTTTTGANQHKVLCPLSKTRIWTGFHVVGAAPELTPSRMWRKVCREAEALGGDTKSWDGGGPCS